MKLHAQFSNRRYANGMTLVEVLIAAIVIAVGLLGIASLQINALQSTTEAQNQSKATDVIAAVADRVKANPDAIDAYNDAIPVDPCSVDPNQPLPIIERCAMSPNGSIDVVSQCTPAEMAAYDLWEINCELQTIIPGALLSITCPGPDCEQMSPMTVNISWQAQNRNPDEGVVAPENTITQSVSATILPVYHEDE
ncbi:MAG: type IV pilus modification protein PilV [Candidatus Thiodiazotropha endolucinida]